MREDEKGSQLTSINQDLKLLEVFFTKICFFIKRWSQKFKVSREKLLDITQKPQKLYSFFVKLLKLKNVTTTTEQ
jgi:hypothetical protein